MVPYTHMQAPQERILGRKMVQKGGQMQEEVDKFYHIPLLDSIKQPLGMETVKEHVRFSTIICIKSKYTYVDLYASTLCMRYISILFIGFL